MLLCGPKKDAPMRKEQAILTQTKQKLPTFSSRSFDASFPRVRVLRTIKTIACFLAVLFVIPLSKCVPVFEQRVIAQLTINRRSYKLAR